MPVDIPKLTTQRRGFTLVELVVGIGILLTLMALALPMFGQVRESARRATDLSRLRQLSLATAIYASEHDGMLPKGRISTASVSGDDYTWVSYQNCWKPLVARVPGLNAMNSCVSVAEGYANADNFGAPQPGSGSGGDGVLGWIYWGGRDNLKGSGGVPSYRSPRRLSDRLTPGSQTLWTCWCWDSNAWPGPSVCPHVGTHFIQYPSGAPLKPPPDGLGVALTDGSASFVSWPELVIVIQSNGFKLYYQP
jgi:prepilin-type N-terminal cleavage/methylation domain-containing protein